MSQQTLIRYIDRFYQAGSETAFIHRRGYRTSRWSYREAAQRASQFARELEAREIEKGDRVMLWGDNSPEWVVAFLGCVLRGVAVVPMDHVATREFALRVYDQVDARLMVCSREHIVNLTADVIEAPGVTPNAGPRIDARQSTGQRNIATTERQHLGGRASSPVQTSSLNILELDLLTDLMIRHSSAPYTPPPLDPADSLEIVFTSGTTAEPKGVVISHRNVLASLDPIEREIGKYLRYERIFHPIRFLNLLPLSHVFGQFLAIFIPPLMRGTVIFQDAMSPGEVIQTIKRERVSVLVTVPRLLAALQDKVERDAEAAGQSERLGIEIKAADGEHFFRRWWRFRRFHRMFGWKFWAFVSGGATLDPDIESFWSRLGFAVVQGYGLTETTSLISVSHPFKLRRGSIGKVLPGSAIKLDEDGEILVRGENVASAYWQGRSLSPVAGNEGWFRTGDIGAVDADGNLFFKGRKKSVIVTSAGMNVYPEDLEAALRKQPVVIDCVVVPVERNGATVPCAVMILRHGDPGAIVRQANDTLAEYQRLADWYVWPDRDFPRTSTQKPRTSEILAIVQGQAPTAGERKPRPGGLAELINGITGRTTSGLAPDASLATDLNLSSIDRVELLSAIEDRYQVELNESAFTAATTVKELEALLRQPSLRRADYDYPRWTQRWPITWLRLMAYYLLVWPATLLLGCPRVAGRRNLRGLRGPVLVIANHVAMIDAGLILWALTGRFRRRLAVAMEGERLHRMRHPPNEFNVLRRVFERLKYALVVSLFNVFPLPQQSGFRQSFAYAGSCVDRGYSVLVFPEGVTTKDGRMAAFKGGIGLLATSLGIPVVPMKIDGLFALKQAGKRMSRPGAIRLTIGESVTFGQDEDPGAVTRDLEARVARLGQ